MRRFLVCSVLLAAAACTQSPDERRFTLQGQILSIAPSRQEATIKHEEIKGLMPAMTMPYKVKEQTLLDGLAPGDLIDAKLLIVPNDAYLIEIRKVGQAPLAKAPADTAVASSAPEL